MYYLLSQEGTRANRSPYEAMQPQIDFRQTNQALIYILLTGLALGVAQYAIGTWTHLGQAILMQLTIGTVIGYGLLFLCFNEEALIPCSWRPFSRQILLALGFAMVGVIGTEVQALVQQTILDGTNYQPGLHPKLYLFNGILSILLGFAFLPWTQARRSNKPLPEKFPLEPEISLDTIPLQEGESTLLFPLDEVLYFEAYDNYSFCHDRNGRRTLCNYSLRTLEERLPRHFVRVHRKYLVNTQKIQAIQSHNKGRYVLTFDASHRPKITSGATFQETVKAWTRL